MEIGNRLKNLRTDNKMTIKNVADKVGVKFQQVSKWENNITRPEYENLISLAKLFNVNTDYLLGLED